MASTILNMDEREIDNWASLAHVFVWTSKRKNTARQDEWKRYYNGIGNVFYCRRAYITMSQYTILCCI